MRFKNHLYKKQIQECKETGAKLISKEEEIVNV